MVKITYGDFEEVEAFIDDIFKKQAADYFSELRDKEEERITLVAYHEEQLAGALVAKRKYDHMYIELLTVDSAFRGQNIGSLLMDEIETIANAKHIINMTLKTRSYQAAGFYKKCGYQCYATLEDMPMKGVAMHYFIKRLV